jgi:diacylglycerol kinase (ATP)
MTLAAGASTAPPRAAPSRASVRVIVNPAAGRGRGAELLPLIRKSFRLHDVTGIDVTSAAGEERALAERALDQGATTLVAAGGDGTWSNVAGAILDRGSDCRLALFAAGTGNDLAKTLGAPVHDAMATAQLAVEGPDMRVDVGRIEGRHFLNIAGFGIDIAVLEDVARNPWLKVGSGYTLSALRQLLAFPGIDIEVESPSRRRAAARHMMLIVANAKHFGGSFHIAPRAELADGLLDAISIHDASPFGRIGLFVATGKGTHIHDRRVVSEQAARFTLRFPAPPAYETDGEYRQARSAELEIACVPKALRVVVAPPSGAGA